MNEKIKKLINEILSEIDFEGESTALDKRNIEKKIEKLGFNLYSILDKTEELQMDNRLSEETKKELLNKIDKIDFMLQNIVGFTDTVNITLNDMSLSTTHKNFNADNDIKRFYKESINEEMVSAPSYFKDGILVYDIDNWNAELESKWGDTDFIINNNMAFLGGECIGVFNKQLRFGEIKPRV